MQRIAPPRQLTRRTRHSLAPGACVAAPAPCRAESPGAARKRMAGEVQNWKQIFQSNGIEAE